MKCVQALVNGCGSNFYLYVDQNLLDLIFTSLEHQNRFVRETGYQTCATIIEVCSSNAILEAENPVMKFAQQFATHLSQGLADNWSQVRMAGKIFYHFYSYTLKLLYKRAVGNNRTNGNFVKINKRTGRNFSQKQHRWCVRRVQGPTMLFPQIFGIFFLTNAPRSASYTHI